MTLSTDVNKFRRAYERAKKAKRKQFIFDGQEVLVSYAKYYLEYIEKVVNSTKGG